MLKLPLCHRAFIAPGEGADGEGGGPPPLSHLMTTFVTPPRPGEWEFDREEFTGILLRGPAPTPPAVGDCYQDRI